MSIALRFAMATWGVTFQSYVPGQTSSYFLAADMKSKLVEMFGDRAAMKLVACCSVNDRGLFNLYVEYDFPPDPKLCMEVMSRACLDLQGLHFQVFDPLNYQAYVKLPFEMNESELDNGLKLIKESIPKLTKRVSEGHDVCLDYV